MALRIAAEPFPPTAHREESLVLTLADEEAHLRSANNHLRNAVYLISIQQDRVERLKVAGLDTVLSEALLSLMNATLRNFIQHREAIREAIARARL